MHDDGYSWSYHNINNKAMRASTYGMKLGHLVYVLYLSLLVRLRPTYQASSSPLPWWSNCAPWEDLSLVRIGSYLFLLYLIPAKRWSGSEGLRGFSQIYKGRVGAFRKTQLQLIRWAQRNVRLKSQIDAMIYNPSKHHVSGLTPRCIPSSKKE